MNVGPDMMKLANHLRYRMQQKTNLVADAEGAAFLLLWGFLLDHAKAVDMDVEQLAREQLEAFIEFARKAGIQITKLH